MDHVGTTTLILLPLLMGSIYYSNHRYTKHPYHWIFVTRKRRNEIKTEAETNKRAKSATTQETIEPILLVLLCFILQEQTSCFLHINSRANTGTLILTRKENFIWDYFSYKVYYGLHGAPRASDKVKDRISSVTVSTR